MAVLTHGPDTCAAVHEEQGAMMDHASEQLDDVAKTLGVTVQGWWIDPPAHTFFMLLDAADAHAISNLMIELRLFHWNSVQIFPLVTVSEGDRLVARR
jgi:hypothetical protein